MFFFFTLVTLAFGGLYEMQMIRASVNTSFF